MSNGVKWLAMASGAMVLVAALAMGMRPEEWRQVHFCRENVASNSATVTALSREGWSYVGPLHNDGINCTVVLFRRSRPLWGGASESGAAGVVEAGVPAPDPAADAGAAVLAPPLGDGLGALPDRFSVSEEKCASPCTTEGCDVFRARCVAAGYGVPDAGAGGGPSGGQP